MSAFEEIKVAGAAAYVQKIRRPIWPPAGWRVYRGNVEATGFTREDAIYNFERALAEQKR